MNLYEILVQEFFFMFQIKTLTFIKKTDVQWLEPIEILECCS